MKFTEKLKAKKADKIENPAKETAKRKETFKTENKGFHE